MQHLHEYVRILECMRVHAHGAISGEHILKQYAYTRIVDTLERAYDLIYTYVCR